MEELFAREEKQSEGSQHGHVPEGARQLYQLSFFFFSYFVGPWLGKDNFKRN